MYGNRKTVGTSRTFCKSLLTPKENKTIPRQALSVVGELFFKDRNENHYLYLYREDVATVHSDACVPNTF